jgi:hypothetical protein
VLDPSVPMQRSEQLYRGDPWEPLAHPSLSYQQRPLAGRTTGAPRGRWGAGTVPSGLDKRAGLRSGCRQKRS